MSWARGREWGRGVSLRAARALGGSLSARDRGGGLGDAVSVGLGPGDGGVAGGLSGGDDGEDGELGGELGEVGVYRATVGGAALPCHDDAIGRRGVGLSGWGRELGGGVSLSKQGGFFVSSRCSMSSRYSAGRVPT